MLPEISDSASGISEGKDASSGGAEDDPRIDDREPSLVDDHRAQGRLIDLRVFHDEVGDLEQELPEGSPVGRLCAPEPSEDADRPDLIPPTYDRERRDAPFFLCSLHSFLCTRPSAALRNASANGWTDRPLLHPEGAGLLLAPELLMLSGTD